LRQLAAPERLDERLRIPLVGIWRTIRAGAGAVRTRRRSWGSAAGTHVRTPTVLQLHEVECAAAVLGIILGHYGRHVPLQELRDACGISRDGGKAVHLLTAAQGYGLSMKALRRSVPTLRDLPVPFIAYWSFNHFLVVEGFSDGVVWVNDPATGPRELSAEAFDRGYTGVVFTATPSASFQPGGTPPTRRTAVLNRLQGMKGPVAMATLLGLALALPALLVAVLLVGFVDRFLFDGEGSFGRVLAAGFFALGVAAVVLTWLQGEALLRVWIRVSRREGRRFLWHALRLPLSFFSLRFATDVAGRSTLNDQVARILAADFVTGSVNLVVLAVYAVVAAAFDPALAVLGIAIGCLNLVGLHLVARAERDAGLRLARERSELLAASITSLQSIETVKATGSEGDVFARWAGLQARLLNARARVERPARALLVVPPVLSIVGAIAVLSVGGFRVIDGVMTIGTLIAVQALLAAAAQPVQDFVRLGGAIHEFDGAVVQLDDVLEQPVDSTTASPHATTLEIAPLRGELDLRGVTFGYALLDPPLLAGLNLRVAAGARVAIVGATGSGKTTLAHLVTGLHPPWSGEILVDGRPRSEWPREALTRGIAAVDQAIHLFPGSIRDNLALWDPSIGDELLARAALSAGVLDLIEARGGFGARVEDGGRNFSGGQRQRIELARALVREPRMLVLDEATSNLDAVAEAQVYANLRERGCTCLIVAHRLSAIRDCDEICVLAQGTIVERGRHEELLAAGGAYARLLAAEEAG
jgi:NHLM bacteriocin system ABC transporter peptidase/ATP-binding protein